MAILGRETGRNAAEISPRAERFETCAARQYLACLAVTGQRGAIEAIVQGSGKGDGGGEARYFLALALALERKAEEAIGHLRIVIDAQPDHVAARTLAYRLLVHQAALSARAQEWQQLSEVVTEAVAVSPPGSDVEMDLGRYTHAIPLGHLRAGRRSEAARLWELQLKQDPKDTRVLHNLALLHYWGARKLETERQTPPLPEWQAAIGYWSVLVNIGPFWEDWSRSKKQAWGFDLSGEDLNTLRSSFVARQLEHYFQTKTDECTQKNQPASAKGYDLCVTAAVWERKAAEWWRKALSLCQAEIEPMSLLGLPGGHLFFKRFGLLPEINRMAASLEGESAGECIAHLRVYFSELGLGAAIVLAEDRNRPEEALRLLDQLPQPTRCSAEVGYVRTLALARKGTNLAGQGKYLAAVEAWKQAQKQAVDLRTGPVDATVFKALLTSLCESVREQAVKGAQREAGRLKQADKLDEAILVLEKARELDPTGPLLEYLCIYLCDRAAAKIEKHDRSGARVEFNRVLTLRPSYARAKEGLGSMLNIEGCEEKDPSRSIALFEQALQFNPDNPTWQRNLATSLREKAVQVFNALNQYTVRSGIDEPVRLTERAAMCACFNLKPDALSTIEAMARTTPGGGEGLFAKVDDELLKRILQDLLFLYKTRRQIRGY